MNTVSLEYHLIFLFSIICGKLNLYCSLSYKPFFGITYKFGLHFRLAFVQFLLKKAFVFLRLKFISKIKC